MFPLFILAAVLCVCLNAPAAASRLYSSAGCHDPDCEEFEDGIGSEALSPNTCQNLDSPDCPYNYNNTMADYQTGDSVTVSPELQKFMATNLPLYLDKITDEYPPTRVDTADVFSGVGGRAFLFLRMYTTTGDKAYLTSAQEYMKTSLANVESIGDTYVGYLWGKTGVWTLGAVVASLSGDEASAAQLVAEVQAVFDQATSDTFAPYDDFDSGRAGLLYAARFLQQFYGGKEVISRNSVVAVAQAIVRRGQELSSNPAWLEWISPNDGETWLGQSHGSAGVLTELLEIPELLTAGSSTRSLIVGTLNHVVASQFASGNFPSEYYALTDDKLVQWDHGAPGVMGCLAKAAKVLNDSSYMESAERAADCTWERGLLTKGLMNCHGIGGNTYMQLYLYSVTKNEKYMWRALQFQKFVSATPDLYELGLMRLPTPNPYAFFTGSYESAVMLWADLLAYAKDTTHELAMPGYVASL